MQSAINQCYPNRKGSISEAGFPVSPEWRRKESALCLSGGTERVRTFSRNGEDTPAGELFDPGFLFSFFGGKEGKALARPEGEPWMRGTVCMEIR